VRIVGLVATGLVAVAAAIAALAGVRSVPDVKRYLRMRRM